MLPPFPPFSFSPAGADMAAWIACETTAPTGPVRLRATARVPNHRARRTTNIRLDSFGNNRTTSTPCRPHGNNASGESSAVYFCVQVKGPPLGVALGGRYRRHGRCASARILTGWSPKTPKFLPRHVYTAPTGTVFKAEIGDCSRAPSGAGSLLSFPLVYKMCHRQSAMQ